MDLHEVAQVRASRELLVGLARLSLPPRLGRNKALALPHALAGGSAACNAKRAADDVRATPVCVARHRDGCRREYHPAEGSFC